MGETARLIHAYFEAFNRDDVEGQLATLAGDVAHEINEGPIETGIDAYRAFKQRMDSNYKERIVDLVVFEQGDRGAAEFTVNGKYVGTDEGLPEATGQNYSIISGIFVTVANGKIARITSYYNLKSWIAAIG
ncbi:isopropylmalate/homocitrate/citramalate synthase [bacterium]|nr:MAG: isopropylmalate/homocitrate/citramalate synthase [bacterium]